MSYSVSNKQELFTSHHSFTHYKRWLNIEELLVESHCAHLTSTLLRDSSRKATFKWKILLLSIYLQVTGMLHIYVLLRQHRNFRSNYQNEQSFPRNKIVKDWLNQAVIPWRLMRNWIVSNLLHATSIPCKPLHQNAITSAFFFTKPVWPNIVLGSSGLCSPLVQKARASIKFLTEVWAFIN